MVGLALLLLGGCLLRNPKEALKLPLTDVLDRRVLKIFGVSDNPQPDRFYDSRLRPFVGEFVADAKSHGVHIASEMVSRLRQVKYVNSFSDKLAASVIAVCNRYTANQRTLGGGTVPLKWLTIEVHRARSSDFTTTDPAKELILLRELMYHELFHCLLNKGHLPANIDGIMSSTFSRGNLRSLKVWPSLVKDMFVNHLSLIPSVN